MSWLHLASGTPMMTLTARAANQQGLGQLSLPATRQLFNTFLIKILDPD